MSMNPSIDPTWGHGFGMAVLMGIIVVTAGLITLAVHLMADENKRAWGIVLGGYLLLLAVNGVYTELIKMALGYTG